MAKIAYVGIPAHGHTNPTLAVMRELVQRGHAVLFYNAESFREKLAVTGVNFHAFPEPLPSEQEISASFHDLIDASLMISGISEPLTRFMIAELKREQPDVVIYDSVAMWGYIAARVCNIPQICFITTFVLDGSAGAVGFGTLARFFLSNLPRIPRLLRWRQHMAQEFGKENSGGVTEYADLNIVFTSAAFHPENSFVDERFRFVGPSINPATRDGAFPVDRLRDGRRVYISLGTIFNMGSGFFNELVTAFSDYPAQFILSVGKQTDIESLGIVPDNFLVYDYLPQLEVLQHVDVFITHGGMNSVHEGLYYGVPEIVIPQHFEQLLNGKQIVNTRTGLILGDTRPYGQVNASELRSAVDTVLNTMDYHQNAVLIGKTLKDAGGYQQAVHEIEQYVAHIAEKQSVA